jgi:tripeptidyl-peptidase-1
MFSFARISSWFWIYFLFLYSACFNVLSFDEAGKQHSSVFMESSVSHLRNDYQLGNRVSFRDNVIHEVVIAIQQRNLTELEALFYERSDPLNLEKYGKYLSRSEIASLTENPASTDAVSSYLSSRGFSIISQTLYGEYVKVQGSISQWENLLNTQFYQFHRIHPFRNAEDSVSRPLPHHSHIPHHLRKKNKLATPHHPLYRAMNYSLPVELKDHISSIFHIVHLPPRISSNLITSSKVVTNSNRINSHNSRSNHTIPEIGQIPVGGTVNPAFLKSYYSISMPSSSSGSNPSATSQSLFASLNNYFSPADLSTFQSKFSIPSQSISREIGDHSGDSVCQSDPESCSEGNLDTQYVTAIANGVPTTYWFVDGNDPFIEWIQSAANSDNPPHVNLIAYGSVEDDNSLSSINAFNIEAQKLALQGVTILASTGDDGVANFQARQNPSECGYHPAFPASSPYVTAIGATQGAESGKPEVACTSDNGGIITTGGGFSNKMNAPSFQTSVISGYFNSLSSSQRPQSGYSTTGRGYPDLSLTGFNYEIIIGGKSYLVSSSLYYCFALPPSSSLLRFPEPQLQLLLLQGWYHWLMLQGKQMANIRLAF